MRENLTEDDKFTIYDHVILSNIWKLDKEDADLLDDCFYKTYSVIQFWNALLTPNSITGQYLYKLPLGKQSYTVNCIHSSPELIRHWFWKSSSNPNLPPINLTLQFRLNKVNKFAAVLVYPRKDNVK